MKKLFCLIVVLIFVSGCSFAGGRTEESREQDTYITGVWISYAELDAMLQGDFETEFGRAVKNCKIRGITDVFVHVRPFCDSIYKSKLFPTRDSARAQKFDVLEYMINACHENDIKFHAWVNPYRVRTADGEISALPDDSPAARWLGDDIDDNDTNVSLTNGIYLDPASSEVRALIIDGIREIIDNYDVDGIHFDDYFYPTTDESFDKVNYTVYAEQTERPLSLEEYRRANINALISGVYTAVKFKDKDITFSVSPSASIEKNYDGQYADVVSWCQSGCVDYIIPQLYFGFNYPDSSFNFDKLLTKWQQEIKSTDTKILIGLAAYKINTKNEPDQVEWETGVDVINRQIKICKTTDGVTGHVYFSYSSMCEYL